MHRLCRALIPQRDGGRTVRGASRVGGRKHQPPAGTRRASSGVSGSVAHLGYLDEGDDAPSPSSPSVVVPIWPIAKATLDESLAHVFEDETTRRFAKTAGFTGDEGQVLPVPSPDSGVSGWLFGTGDGANPFVFGALPSKLPPASYRIEWGETPASKEAYLGWGLGSYSFKRYKTSSAAAQATSAGGSAPLLRVDGPACKEEVERIVSAIFLGRDLINTPCSDMGPADLARAAEKLGKTHGASVRIVRGSELEKGFPLVHAVGRAAAAGREPLVVDLAWGTASSSSSSSSPGGNAVTIVGKGVCFDTGGLDIKPPSNMVTMKKDMGGAASVLSLAAMVMAAKLDVRLRVMIPCVENCVAGNAFRPSDVITSRSGQTVEIGNTDAEGRLILADCLTAASEAPDCQPDLLLDMATLTGAHRVALGWDLPGIFTDNEDLARELHHKGLEFHDPVWRLPLWRPYAKMIDSKVADMNNIGSAPWGGAITAALFLEKFTNNCPNWVHIDFNGWTREKPGFPEGGEPQAVRGIYEMLKERYGTRD